MHNSNNSNEKRRRDDDIDENPRSCLKTDSMGEQVERPKYWNVLMRCSLTLNRFHRVKLELNSRRCVW